MWMMGTVYPKGIQGKASGLIQWSGEKVVDEGCDALNGLSVGGSIQGQVDNGRAE